MGKSILIVDDDYALRTAVCQWMRNSGYVPLEAESSERALDILTETQADLVIVDLKLPGMDGLTLSRELLARNPDRPVILITAYADLNSAQQALNAGVYEYLTKPLNLCDLLAGVRRALTHRRLLQENQAYREDLERKIETRTAELVALNDQLRKEVAERRQAEQKLAAQADDLARANAVLEEKERLLAAYGQIAQLSLSSLDLDQILDALGYQIVKAGIFRSVMIALVHEESRIVEVVRSLIHSRVGEDGVVAPDSILRPNEEILGITYSLDDDNVAAQVARTGDMQVIDAWTDLRLDRRVDDSPGQWEDKVAYFIPVKREDRVLAVLATGSTHAGEDEMRHRIAVMRPLLDQVAIALEHARLYRETREHARTLSELNRELEIEMAERQRTEQELVRLERLRALGEMSAGVSHNLNNILTGIVGPADLIRLNSKDAKVLRDAETIVTSALRARDLVRRLHNAVRKTEDTLHPVEVNRVIREAMETARPRWKDEPEARGVALKLELDLQDVPDIQGTHSGLHDILINLLFNAVDAMPEGGVITVQTGPVDEGVRLVVRDTGVGMDEAVRSRVFEPFFTTKTDVGTGLGLSTVYGTVTRWNGHIHVESEPGVGTAFILEFRLWEGEAAVEDAPVTVRQVRRGKVLIVEDDDLVCDVLSRMLSRDHDVAVVHCGRDALDGFSSGQYDVAMIDLGMPEMSGNLVAEEMHRLDPCLATVLITGWELEEGDPRASVFDAALQKPFEDAARVRDVVAWAVECHDIRTRE